MRTLHHPLIMLLLTGEAIYELFLFATATFEK